MLLTPVQNRPQPPVEAMAGKLAPLLAPPLSSASIMRPPQPLGRVSPGDPLCHWLVWSECENRASGTLALLLVLALLYCATLLNGITRLPTLATTAACPWLYSDCSAGMLGCRP